jgi:serpin B
MRAFLKISTLLSFVLLIVMSCQSDVTGPDKNGELSRTLNDTEKQLVESGQDFSFNLFRNVVKEDSSDNIFISPLSISVALGMTLNGAKGETFNQMRHTLALEGLDMEAINAGYQSLIKLLQNSDPKVKMEIANSVWSKQGFPVEKAFTDNLKKYFDAKATELDFDDPAAADAINKWVSDNTNGLIEKIIEGGIPPEMVMYLINAIYFKGDWTYQFDKEKTREQPFYLENGEREMVDMMNQERDFNIYRSDKVQVIDLPYGDSLFSMTVLMPVNSETPLNNFIAENLTQQNFNAWISALSSIDSPLQLPKFELEYEKKLNDILISMGMEDAFNGYKADLTGINPNPGLYISEVKHKTYVKVDEEGTEAAAVTSVGIGVTSVPQSFSVNRPFIFVIREHNSGAILFMGKVNNPNAS